MPRMHVRLLGRTGTAAKGLSLSGSVALALLYASSAMAESAQADVEDRLFHLTLDELLTVRIAGAAVRDLGLNQTPHTDNPLRQKNQQMAAAVEVIDANTLRARGLRTVVEAAENLVGVSSGDSPGEPHSFSMRGFTRNSVNVLYDGISMGASTLNMRPQGTFNLDRVEIIKGPAALHHGQGAAAGSINLITRKPQLGQAQINEAVLSVGRYQQSELSLGSAGPLSDAAAYRLDVNQTRSDGWVDDSAAHSFNATASSIWQVNADVMLGLSLNYLRDELPAYWGTPLVPLAVARQPLRGVIETADGRVLDEVTRFNNYNVADHVIGSDSLWTTVNLEWAVTDTVQSRSTLYRFSADRDWRNAESYSFDSDLNRVGRDRLLVGHNREVWGVNSALTFAHTVAGVEQQLSIALEYSDNDFARQIGFDIDNPNPYVDDVDLYQPQPGRFGAVDIRHDALKLINTAIVIEDVMALSPVWQLSLATRLENLDMDRRRFNFAGVLNPNTSIDTDYRHASYRLGLVHAFADELSGYAQYTEHFDNIEADFGVVSRIVNFEPSHVRQTELGLKATLDDNRWELTAAVFDIKKTVHAQLTGEPKNLQTQQSQGLEFAVRAALTNDLRIGGNVTYTDARYGDYFDWEAGVDASGNTPANVPEWMASLWASVNAVGGLPVELGFGYNYVSDRYANSDNTVTLTHYQLLNAFAAYNGERYRIAFHVRNLGDEIYAPWSDPNYPNQVILGSPRVYDLSLQLKF